ncbi:transglycosylase SLT domain-containing protein [Thalassospira xianhensis]|uniref:transglycosylase SLT domain-containing protein n=1 Tax=Thalassospira xianhensis TaxID=478503 RepID=UPI000DED5886|nr:transglycosylase SLT domain-containing protein [Thalassospira xianhensis]
MKNDSSSTTEQAGEHTWPFLRQGFTTFVPGPVASIAILTAISFAIGMYNGFQKRIDEADAKYYPPAVEQAICPPAPSTALLPVIKQSRVEQGVIREIMSATHSSMSFTSYTAFDDMAVIRVYDVDVQSMLARVYQSKIDDEPVDIVSQPEVNTDNTRGTIYAQNETQSDILTAVLTAEEKTGAPSSLLMAFGWLESRFDPAAKSRISSARGLFQFTKVTWMRAVNEFGNRHGLEYFADKISVTHDQKMVVTPTIRKQLLAMRYDPEISAVMTGEFIETDRERLRTLLEREPTDTDLYLTHLLGISDGANFLKALESTPDLAAEKIIPKAYRNNKQLFADDDIPEPTVAEAYRKIDITISGLVKRYEELLARAGEHHETTELWAYSPRKKPEPKDETVFVMR